MTAFIHPAQPADAALLAFLIRESFRDVAERYGLTRCNCPTHPSNCTSQWVQQAQAKGVRYYLLEVKGEPAGCVAMERPDESRCYLERLAVLPPHRGRGYGALLVRHVLEEAKRLEIPRVELAMIAEDQNLAAWYQRLGFTSTAQKTFPHLPFAVAFLACATSPDGLAHSRALALPHQH